MVWLCLLSSKLSALLSSIGSYAYTENDDTLFVHLYMGSTLTKNVNGRDVEVSVASGFPWDGKVSIQVRAKDTEFVLALRKPDWCDTYTLRGCEVAEEKDGYLYIKKDWTETDTIELDFPMEVKIMEAGSRVREDAGKVAVCRGPVVYCLEETDNGNSLHLLSVSEQALNHTSGCAHVSEESICGVSAKTITLPGFREAEKQPAHGLYQMYAAQEKTPVTLKFVPYYMWANRGENEMTVWVRR